MGYNPNIPRLEVGYNPLILTIDPNFRHGTSKHSAEETTNTDELWDLFDIDASGCIDQASRHPTLDPSPTKNKIY